MVQASFPYMNAYAIDMFQIRKRVRGKSLEVGVILPARTDGAMIAESP